MKTRKFLTRMVLASLLMSCTALLPAQTNALNATQKETSNTKKMKEYVLLIRLPLNYGPEQAADVREKWNALTDAWKADGTFVTSFVFPTESYVISGKERLVRKEAVVSDATKVVTSMVLKAASYEEVLALAKLAPVLEQGGTIEVREAFPRPQPADTTTK